jgi:hypothetical protein
LNEDGVEVVFTYPEKGNLPKRMVCALRQYPLEGGSEPMYYMSGTTDRDQHDEYADLDFETDVTCN